MTHLKSLPHAERWMREALELARPAFDSLQVTINMTHALERLDQLRQSGVAASATHLMIQAAAHALAAQTDAPDPVDIGLSIGGDHFIAPVLVIENAQRKELTEVVEETARRVPEVRQADNELWDFLNRWGRLVPFKFLRKIILRRALSPERIRRKVGTFQISTVPVDSAVASTFLASGVLVAGSVAARPHIIDGALVVCPTMILSLSIDHGVWDGRKAARFLSAVKMDLETKQPVRRLTGRIKT